MGWTTNLNWLAGFRPSTVSCWFRDGKICSQQFLLGNSEVYVNYSQEVKRAVFGGLHFGDTFDIKTKTDEKPRCESVGKDVLCGNETWLASRRVWKGMNLLWVVGNYHDLKGTSEKGGALFSSRWIASLWGESQGNPLLNYSGRIYTRTFVGKG